MIQDHSTLLKRVLDWVVIRQSDSIRVDGLWVGVFTDNKNNEVLNKVRDALLLIKTHDPYRYKRVLRETDRILVTLIPGAAGAWAPALRRCLVDARLVRSHPPAMIANAIVHEVTHGLIIRYGVSYEKDYRARIENICLRQERAFASKLPDDIEKGALSEWIGRDDATSQEYTDEARRDGFRAGMIEMAADIEMPVWLMKRLLRLRGRWRWRRQRP
jgi:hypothetical protein